MSTQVCSTRDNGLDTFFIVGVGRSGTSLVHAMLNAHPGISVLPENHVFRRYVGPYFRRRFLARAGARSFQRALEADTDFGRVEIDSKDLLRPFVEGEEAFHPSAVYRALLLLFAEQQGTDVVGDKDPRLVDFLPELSRYLPKARVVHVVRDPRDVLLSRRKAAWSSGRSDLAHVLTYKAQLERGRTTGPFYFQERYTEVRYEDLLQAPEGTLRRLCSFIGLEYRQEMLSYGQSASELITEDEWQWKKETTGPLIRDNMGKWKGELSPAVRVLTEKTCIEPYPELGYSPAEEGDNEDIGYQWRAAIHVAELVAKMFSRAYPLRTLAG